MHFGQLRRGRDLFKVDSRQWRSVTDVGEGYVPLLLAFASTEILKMAETRGLRITTWNGKFVALVGH